MGLRSALGVNLKTFFNPSAWIGYDDLRDNSVSMWRFVKELFVVTPAKNPEDFDAAVKRLNVSERELLSRAKFYRKVAWFWVAVAFVCVALAIHMLFKAELAAFAFTTAMFILSVAHFFRFHFYWYQMKNRKLGCTFKEWKSDLLKSDRGN